MAALVGVSLKKGPATQVRPPRVAWVTALNPETAGWSLSFGSRVQLVPFVDVQLTTCLVAPVDTLPRATSLDPPRTTVSLAPSPADTLAGAQDRPASFEVQARGASGTCRPS